MEADFSGYATKAGIKCSDGRTITPEAFKHMDGQTIPLVWAHKHDEPQNVLGHALLEARSDGVYAYGYFNKTVTGVNAKALVEHKDVKALSIWANQLVEKSGNVLHGMIRELSLVLAGANIGAFIDNVAIQHSDGEVEQLNDEAIISMGLALEHADPTPPTPPADPAAPTYQDIYDSMNPDQKELAAHMVEVALATKVPVAAHTDIEQTPAGDGNTDGTDAVVTTNEGDLNHQEGTTDMTRNVFENNEGSTTTKERRPTLSHDQLKTIQDDAVRMGSYKDAFLAHAGEYGITNIELLFPDAQMATNSPEWISRRMEWVAVFLSGTKHSPFSRIKTMSADITLDTARAKGYVKGTLKKDEFFALLKRVTTPVTIYKKQKLDRDDIIDITDLDVVAWIKGEMRVMLDEEIARAGLIGDGREVDDDDKILEPTGASGAGIRPIAQDDEFYAHRVVVAANISQDDLVEAILRARPAYRGSGNPTMFCTEDLLTDLLLSKDRQNRKQYSSQGELETTLRVSRIVTVPVMEDATTSDGDLLAVLVNLADYTFGSDKGGNINMFDDFDIDYNQYKYLIETRLSGALTSYKSAIVVSRTGGTSVTPAVPTFNVTTGVLTVPNTTGVVYKNGVTDVTLSSGAQTAIVAGASVEVVATPATGYYFPHNFDADWSYTRNP